MRSASRNCADLQMCRAHGRRRPAGGHPVPFWATLPTPSTRWQQHSDAAQLCLFGIYNRSMPFLAPEPLAAARGRCE